MESTYAIDIPSDNGKSDDRISNLPESILHDILSFLDTIEVVRTSAVSRRWRYLWTSIPYLDFDFYHFYLVQNDILDFGMVRSNFKDFVDWVLMNGSSNLQSYHLSCSDVYDSWTVVRWIHAAIYRKVQELDLSFSPTEDFGVPHSEPFKLPHFLVACESLQVLKLNLYGHVLKFPRSVGLKGLTSLKLVNVELEDEGLVQNFFSSCPQLKHVALISCVLEKLKVLEIVSTSLKFLNVDNTSLDGGTDNDDGLCKTVLKVYCPNLVWLQYMGPIALDYSLQNLSSLRNGSICLVGGVLDLEASEDVGYRMCNILTGFCNVHALKLSIVFLEEIYPVLGKPGCFCAPLYNLKSLKLCAGVDGNYMEVIIHLLKCSPNLKDLLIVFEKSHKWHDYWELQDEAISCLAFHLRIVKLVGFLGKENEVELVRFILKNGLVLENLIITWGSYPENLKQQKIWRFPRSSSNAKVSFHRPPKSQVDFFLL